MNLGRFVDLILKILLRPQVLLTPPLYSNGDRKRKARERDKTRSSVVSYHRVL